MPPSVAVLQAVSLGQLPPFRSLGRLGSAVIIQRVTDALHRNFLGLSNPANAEETIAQQLGDVCKDILNCAEVRIWVEDSIGNHGSPEMHSTGGLQ